MAADNTDNGRRHQRRNDERRKRYDGISTYDEFNGVERPGQRRIERCCNRPCGTAADEDAHVPSPQFQLDADLRGNAAGDLGVTGLEPDGGAETVGDDILHADNDTVRQRQATAMQRIRLDRVDHGFLAGLR